MVNIYFFNLGKENSVMVEKSVDEASESVVVSDENNASSATTSSDTNSPSSKVRRSPRKRKHSSDDVTNTGSSSECLLKAISLDSIRKSGSRFWPVGWRSELCKCSDCMVGYNSCIHSLPFVTSSVIGLTRSM